MAANRFSSDAKRAFEGGALYGLDPGDGGTLDFSNKSGMVFRCPGDGSNVRLLPAEGDHPHGMTCIVMNTGTGDLLVKEDSNTTTIATIQQTEAARIMLMNTNGGSKWGAYVYS